MPAPVDHLDVVHGKHRLSMQLGEEVGEAVEVREDELGPKSFGDRGAVLPVGGNPAGAALRLAVSVFQAFTVPCSRTNEVPQISSTSGRCSCRYGRRARRRHLDLVPWSSRCEATTRERVAWPSPSPTAP